MGSNEKFSLISSGTITRPADITAYTAGDVITGDTPVALTFSGLGVKINVGGIIDHAMLFSGANPATKLNADLFLFSATLTPDADNAAFTPTDAELITCIGHINFSDSAWVSGDATVGAGGNALVKSSNIGIPISQDTIYGVLVARNAYAPVSGEVLTLKLFSRY